MIGRSHSKRVDTYEYSLAMEARCLVAAISLCSLIVFSTFGTGTVHAANAIPAATSYSCSPNHCYGRDLWSGAITGGSTTVLVNSMGQGDGFVDNEMWLIQQSSSGDCAQFLNLCWTEGGYAAGGSNNGTTLYFFFADVRPCSCGGYHEHDSTELQGGDFGSYAGIGIYQTSSSTWQVNVFGAVTSYSGTSTGQTMSPTMIVIGQELSGTSGALAPTANFLNNEWRDTTVENWHNQTADGTLDPCISGICPSNNPPWSGWVSGQDPPNYPGGNFYTCTLPSGGQNPC